MVLSKFMMFKSIFTNIPTRFILFSILNIILSCLTATLVKAADSNQKTGQLSLSEKNFEQSKISVEESWKNKNYLILGDSSTQTGNPKVGNFGVGYRHNWWDISNTSLHAKSFMNYAYTGASFREHGQENWKKLRFQVDNAISTNFKPDVVIVAAIANDGLVKLGTFESAMSKNINDLDMSITADAMRYSFRKLNEAYPNAIMFSVTPKQLASTPQIKRKPMIDLLIQMSNEYGFQVIDVASTSGISRDFEVIGGAGRDLYDGVHPNENGIKKIANAITPVIKSRMSN